MSILHGYPYTGLHYQGIYTGYPYPSCCLCDFGGRILEVHVGLQAFV